MAVRGKKKYLPPLPLYDFYVNRTTDYVLKTYFIEVKIPKGAIYQNLPLRYHEFNEIQEETFS
jgi:hypothetical protein